MVCHGHGPWRFIDCLAASASPDWTQRACRLCSGLVCIGCIRRLAHGLFAQDPLQSRTFHRRISSPNANCLCWRCADFDGSAGSCLCQPPSEPGRSLTANRDALATPCSCKHVSALVVGEKIAPESITPAWFIPGVGGILVPLSGPQLGYHAAAWFFLCIGLLLWLFLMPILLARLIFVGPLPPAAQPSLLILLPLPALGMVSYVTMSGQLDVFAISLFTLMLFIAVILLSLTRSLTRSSFNMSWWAFSFPTAACSGSCSFMALQTGAPAAQGLALAALLICSVVILGLLLKTIVAIGETILRGGRP